MKKLIALFIAVALFGSPGLAQVAQKVKSPTGILDFQNQSFSNVPSITTADGKSYLDSDYSNQLFRTTLGDEGIRYIGALGGYTLEGLLRDTAVKGPTRDLPVFNYILTNVPPNLTVNWTAGDVYSPSLGYYHLAPGTKTLTDFAVNYAYWDHSNPNVVSWTTGSRPVSSSSNVYLATFYCGFGLLTSGSMAPCGGDLPSLMYNANSYVWPSLIASGIYYTPVGTNLNDLIMEPGVEYQDMVTRVNHGARDLRNPLVTPFILGITHTNSTTYGYVLTNQVPVGLWDNGTNLVACNPTNWYRGMFSSIAVAPYMIYIFPDTEYTNLTDAINGTDPAQPSGFDPYVVQSTAYISKGDDTTLRTDAGYWPDRRFMMRRGASGSGGGSTGGSSKTPSLYQVLLQGASSGGIFPDLGTALPASDGQAANKLYVDSTVNKINTGRAYVDQGQGDDVTALLESSILPYSTIQKAIDDAAVVATSSNRYVVTVSPGDYYEDITIKNYVSVVGVGDVQSTIIYGTVTFPPTMTDTDGVELHDLSIYQYNNAPAVVFNMGDDLAYGALRACSVWSLYDNDATNKATIRVNKGAVELYGSTWVGLDVIPTNGAGSVCYASLFEHTADPGNPGLSSFVSSSSTFDLNSSDINDDISVFYNHDNTDATCINTIQDGVGNIYLNDGSTTYSNRVKFVSQHSAQGRTLWFKNTVRLYLAPTNAVNAFFGYSEGGTADGVAIIRGAHVRMPVGSTSNIWLGAAVGTYDRLRVYDSVYIQNFADQPYPKVYTNEGAAGKFFINTVTESGDQLFGGAVDMSAVNTPAPSTPQVGHVKMYAQVTAGVENPYIIDSSGNILRWGRDVPITVHNAETNTLNPGEAVYILTNAISSTVHWVKRAKADDLSTMPAIGFIMHNGGIPASGSGRCMKIGRTEVTGINTTGCIAGQPLYLSSTVGGGFTNVSPATLGAYEQQLGYCNVVGVNGSISVHTYKVDTLGNLKSTDYARSTNTSTWDKAAVDAAWASNGVVTLNGETSGWNNASANAAWASNGVVEINGHTSGWNTAVANATFASNGVVAINGLTSGWNSASANATFGSNGVVTINGLTSGWNNASANATFASNGVVAHNNSTSYWNTVGIVSNNATFGSNGVVTINGLTSGWNSASANATFGSNGVVTLNGLTSGWNNASANATFASNGVVTLNNRTSLWNTVSIVSNNATFGSNGVVTINGLTSGWNSASVNATWASNGVVTLNNSTGLWNTVGAVSNNATFGSNGVVTINGLTSGWNNASVNATWASNGVVTINGNTNNYQSAYLTIGYTVTNSWGFNEPSPTTNAPNDIYLSSAFQKARNWKEFHAMTESGTVAGQIFIRDERNPIRTYTAVTNFTASTTSTNLVAMTGTIPALYTIGVVVTNVTAGTNLWISLEYATTNGMKDL